MRPLLQSDGMSHSFQIERNILWSTLVEVSRSAFNTYAWMDSKPCTLPVFKDSTEFFTSSIFGGYWCWDPLLLVQDKIRHHVQGISILLQNVFCKNSQILSFIFSCASGYIFVFCSVYTLQLILKSFVCCVYHFVFYSFSFFNFLSGFRRKPAFVLFCLFCHKCLWCYLPPLLLYPAFAIIRGV